MAENMFYFSILRSRKCAWRPETAHCGVRHCSVYLWGASRKVWSILCNHAIIVIHLLDAFLLLIKCAKRLISLRKLLLL